jgi:hypothetical protein
MDDKTWERLLYRGAPIKQRVLGDLPDSGGQLSDRFWQSFKQKLRRQRKRPSEAHLAT